MHRPSGNYQTKFKPQSTKLESSNIKENSPPVFKKRKPPIIRGVKTLLKSIK